DCPSSAQVQELLEPLLILVPQSPESPDLARIEPDGGSLRISLHRADGRILGEGLIAGGHPCRALAQAAAVLVAVWESAQHPEFVAVVPPLAARARAPMLAIAADRSRPVLDIGAGVGVTETSQGRAA